MAWEHFELKGERALKHAFDVLDESGRRAKSRISLGSHDLTNNIWRETTKPAPAAKKP